MDKLRKDAREVLQRDPWNRPNDLRAADAAAAQNNLHQLWQDVSTHDNSTHLNVSVHGLWANVSLTHFAGLREYLCCTQFHRKWLGPAAAE